MMMIIIIIIIIIIIVIIIIIIIIIIINICYSPTGRSVLAETVPEVLSTARYYFSLDILQYLCKVYYIP